ncbi:hypothetical protein BC629DRAFT_1483758 [Irpex lacteus]|nr:hypothetical protein BC629DRAFT_1483758 [Irpex lacteus]
MLSTRRQVLQILQQWVRAFPCSAHLLPLHAVLASLGIMTLSPYLRRCKTTPSSIRMRMTHPAALAAIMVVRVWDDDGGSSELADSPDAEGLAFEDSTVVIVAPDSDDRVVVSNDRKDWTEAELKDVPGIGDLSAVLDIDG